MVKMSLESKEFIRKHFPRVDLESATINDLLDMLDDLMCDSLDEDYAPTAETREIESVYDEIYCCN